VVNEVCHTTEPLLPCLVNGTMSAEDRMMVLSHLCVCSRCRSALEDWIQIAQELRSSASENKSERVVENTWGSLLHNLTQGVCGEPSNIDNETQDHPNKSTSDPIRQHEPTPLESINYGEIARCLMANPTPLQVVGTVLHLVDRACIAPIWAAVNEATVEKEIS
jgi:hypothetical protein